MGVLIETLHLFVWNALRQFEMHPLKMVLLKFRNTKNFVGYGYTAHGGIRCINGRTQCHGYHPIASQLENLARQAANIISKATPSEFKLVLWCVLLY